ncbi:glycosyltransferase family 2 protein [Leptolyngbya sp. GB1-A1]|uniref:glycosyltransferase family 2 protein n=1 Tax=Leptolyngbya sp. GB1-A1 TaxID=2933908 RepID=UPI0032982064
MLELNQPETSDREISAIKISLCICTMNRPDELSNCLRSVFESTELPDEIIVSDDSLNGKPTQTVTSEYSTVIYQEGPHRGLGPNRNACIRRATGTHIIFIDDDVCVPPDFFTLARQGSAGPDAKRIITGYEMKHVQGKVHKVRPHNADFWGLQRLPISYGCRAVVINSTIFPRDVFEKALFDELLRYGSEEIDMAHHATALGYQIVYQDNLYVNHYPSPINREQYQRFVHASRLYATTKSYWQYDRSIFKALAYVVLAPFQLIGSAAKTGNLKNMWGACQSISTAYSYIFRYFKNSQK